MPISEENKSLARYLRSVFGGRPEISRYWDDDHENAVDIVEAPDVPTANVTTYATLGLSDHPGGLAVAGVPLGVELVLAARDYFEDSPNILSTCAFNVINSGMRAEPGAIFPRVIELYRGHAALTDILFVPPFLWPLETQKFDTKTVAWLLAVPISEAERDYAKANGPEALEAQFEHHQIDIFDLDRPSIA